MSAESTAFQMALHLAEAESAKESALHSVSMLTESTAFQLALHLVSMSAENESLEFEWAKTYSWCQTHVPIYLHLLRFIDYIIRHKLGKGERSLHHNQIALAN